MTIARDRWQLHLKTRGQHYHEQARELEALHGGQPEVGAGTAALALHALAELLERARLGRLTRHQHVLFRLGELIGPRRGRRPASARRAARAAAGDARPERRPALRRPRRSPRWPRCRRARPRSRWRDGRAALDRAARTASTDAGLPRSRPRCGCPPIHARAGGTLRRHGSQSRTPSTAATPGSAPPPRRLTRNGESKWKTPRLAPSPSSAWAPCCRTRPTRRLLAGSRGGRYSITTSCRTAGIRRSTTTRPARSRQDLLEDRRLGARAGTGTRSSGSSPIPPRVSDAMDDRAEVGDRLHARRRSTDYGWPRAPARPRAHGRDPGQRHGRREALPDRAAHRVPGVCARAARRRRASPRCRRPARGDRRRAARARRRSAFREITEDTMPGELANIIAGRVANLFNLHGPNYVSDAACASAMAAMRRRDRGPGRSATTTPRSPAASTATWGPSTFVKFCKIGALSATGTPALCRRRRRLRHGRGRGGVPAQAPGRRRARRRPDLRRAARHRRRERRQGQGHHRAQPGRAAAGGRAGLAECRPVARAAARLVEGHGTSTRVGDVVEVRGPERGVRPAAASRRRASPLGSVKSNIGHLKGAAGAAGLLKVALALHHKRLPPSLQLRAPEPGHRLRPLAVRRQHRAARLARAACGVRRAGVSAFGFGGTNFHAVLEEYVPGRLHGQRPRAVVASRRTRRRPRRPARFGRRRRSGAPRRLPLRGALVLGRGIGGRAARPPRAIHDAAAAGHAPAAGAARRASSSAPRSASRSTTRRRPSSPTGPRRRSRRSPPTTPAMWKALRAQGIFRGQGRRRRSPSSTPARARSTSTCSPSCGARADRARDVPRGRPCHDAAARPAAQRLRVRRRVRRRGWPAPRRSAADRDHAARRARRATLALTHLLAAYGIGPTW